MNSRNLLRNALFLLPLYFIPSFLQLLQTCFQSAKVISEVDVPEIQLLASNLKPEECVKLVSLHSHSSLSKAQIQKLAREQSCFRRLVTWICQLRTVTRNTYPILNNLLERIGRRDLVTCLAEFGSKTSNSPKVVRDIQAVDDSEDYEGGVATATEKPKKEGPNSNVQTSTPYSNHTIEKLIAHTINISVKTMGIVLVSTTLVTCCCTLFVRNRIASLCNKIRGKKRKGKFVQIGGDSDHVSKSYFIRKPRAKRKREPSYEMVHAATQNNVVTVVKEPEEPQSIGCYKCYKKKRKKGTRKPHR